MKPPASPTPQAPTSGNERSEAIKEDLKPLAAAEEDLKLKETQWSLEEKVALVVNPASTEDVKERARLAKEAAEEAAARAALALEKAKSVATFSWPWKGEEALASSSFVTKNMSQSPSASTNLPHPPRPISHYTSSDPWDVTRLYVAFPCLGSVHTGQWMANLWQAESDESSHLSFLLF